MEFNTIIETLEAIKHGSPVIVVDDHDLDNTGSIIYAANKVTLESIKFIKQHCDKFIYFTGDKLAFSKTNLSPVYEPYGSDAVLKNMTVTTNIKKASEPDTIYETINSILKQDETKTFYPDGVIYPVISRLGGVLKRVGHKEAIVDLVKLAKLGEFGVLSLLVDKDKNPMRLNEIIEFSKQHHIKIISVSSLIEYRRNNESLIKKAAEAKLPTKFGDFKMVGFENAINGEHHVALVKGDIKPGEEILVRVHSECLTGDAFGSLKCDCGEQLQEALKKIEKAGKGVLLYMRQEGRGIGLINKIKAYHLQDLGMDTVEANIALGFEEDLRDYGIGALILKDLGISKMRLITNNPLKISGLSGYGLEVTSREPIMLNHNEKNLEYLKTKQKKMGHLLKFKE
ncbi:GTP cyclohydrolase II [Acholeplasma granularum]|uniref:GTP cyclohydrolase II n=1 Tax=Acholeplasma granularum TaxID=264635 RepID=UPI0004ADFF87|nr:GTP cyclohydrolase II [Acholeplasma granularum]